MALDFTSFYDAQLGGQGFWEQDDSSGYYAPGADDLEDSAKLRIPGGDTTVIQKFGRATREFSVPGAINAADLTSLQAKRGQTVTLVRASGTSVSVYVDGLANVRRDSHDLGVFLFTIKMTL